MKKIFLLFCLILPIKLQAQDISTDNSAVKTDFSTETSGEVKTAKSPHNRVALLELYTSEGCSSCPPAERFLSELKTMGISARQLVAMAFHVTYWDHIGWQDRFASSQFDERQRVLAKKNKNNNVYTPQFVFSGNDYRRYASFSEDLNKLLAQKATIDLELSSRILSIEKATAVRVLLKADASRSKASDVGFYLAVLENNLSSNVDDGENNGKQLHHDFVVRQLNGPYFENKSGRLLEKQQTIPLSPEWKLQDLSVVAFAEDSNSGEILQAVRLEF